MDPEDLNNIILHAVPISWPRQAYIQVLDFEGRSYKETCNTFERMEIAEAIYEGGSPYRNTQQAEADRASYGREKKG